jgi:K319-like protein
MRGQFRIVTGLVALTVIFSGPFAALSVAQQNQPVYPAYDGFQKNPDGSYTLSFRYFSHNSETVTIPLGENNSFSPAPADRQQPTTFKPGDWRFQCVMVVGPEFDGKLKWTLAHAGTTTGTSEHMLQSNWNLVEGAADLKQIDYAKVPRGVCLNRPPQVRVLGTVANRGGGGAGSDDPAPAAGRGRGRGAPPVIAVTASVGERYSLFGSVNDEGLPRSGKLTVGWKQLSGPGTVTFENAAVARTRATFSAPGEYVLELTGTDSELSATTRVTVNVK